MLGKDVCGSIIVAKPENSSFIFEFAMFVFSVSRGLKLQTLGEENSTVRVWSYIFSVQYVLEMSLVISLLLW